MQRHKKQTHIGEQSVEEVAINDDSMNTAKRNEKEKSRKVGVVAVANAGVDPRTVVVHLHDAPG